MESSEKIAEQLKSSNLLDDVSNMIEKTVNSQNDHMFIYYIGVANKNKECDCIYVHTANFLSIPISFSKENIKHVQMKVYDIFSSVGKKSVGKSAEISVNRFEKSVEENFRSSIKQEIMHKIKHEKSLREKASEERDAATSKLKVAEDALAEQRRYYEGKIMSIYDELKKESIETERFKRLYGQLKTDQG
jgi:hypothetical protein